MVPIRLAWTDGARPRPWTVGYGIGAFLCAVFVYGATIAFLRDVLALSMPPGPSALVIDATLLATLVALSHVDHFDAEALGVRYPRWAGTLGLTVRALMVLVVVDGLWGTILGEREVFNPFRGLSSASLVVVVLTGLAAAITAPVAEELFFEAFYIAACAPV